MKVEECHTRRERSDGECKTRGVEVQMKHRMTEMAEDGGMKARGQRREEAEDR